MINTPREGYSPKLICEDPGIDTLISDQGHGGIYGSSELSMVGACLVGPSSVGGQHDSQPIMIKVFESVGEATDFFDDQVDGFGVTVLTPWVSK
jgi:hypothetical protein